MNKTIRAVVILDLSDCMMINPISSYRYIDISGYMGRQKMYAVRSDLSEIIEKAYSLYKEKHGDIEIQRFLVNLAEMYLEEPEKMDLLLAKKKIEEISKFIIESLSSNLDYKKAFEETFEKLKRAEIAIENLKAENEGLRRQIEELKKALESKKSELFDNPREQLIRALIAIGMRVKEKYPTRAESFSDFITIIAQIIKSDDDIDFDKLEEWITYFY